MRSNEVVTRRRFLATFAVGAASPFLSLQRRNALKVGYHPLTWGGEHFWQACDEIAALGFPATEVFGDYILKYEERIGEFKEQMARRRLKLVSAYGGGALSDPAKRQEDIERNLRIARILRGADAEYLIMGGGLKRKEGNRQEDFENFAATVNEIGRRVSLEYGLRACYHPHLDTLGESREDIAKIMELTDERYVYLAPDTGHLAAGGSDPVEVFKTYRSRIAYTHFKDYNPEIKEKYWFFVELGRGTINFPAIVELLVESRFQGWIMVELDRTRTTPRLSAEISKRYLTDVLKIM